MQASSALRSLAMIAVFIACIYMRDTGKHECACIAYMYEQPTVLVSPNHTFILQDSCTSAAACVVEENLRTCMVDERPLRDRCSDVQLPEVEEDELM
jgi:hypothetical protein